MLVQVVLPHIKGTMEDLHVGQVVTTMSLSKHLPNGLVDASSAGLLKQFIAAFLEVCGILQPPLDMLLSGTGGTG